MRYLTLVTLVMFLTRSTTAADDEGTWKLPNLNPFSKGENSNVQRPARFGKSEPSKWSLPSMPKIPTPKLPSWSAGEKAKPSRSSGPSTWTKMSQGTKNALGKTKQTLMPWTNTSDNKQSSRSSSSSRKKSNSNDGFFPSLFGGPKEEKKIQTVNEFLNQPNVPIQ